MGDSGSTYIVFLNQSVMEIPRFQLPFLGLNDYMKSQVKQIKERDGRLFPFWNGDMSVHVLDTVGAN